jgi:hypothetical protein
MGKLAGEPTKKYVVSKSALLANKKIISLEFLRDLAQNSGNRYQPIYFDGEDIFMFASRPPRDSERNCIQWEAIDPIKEPA